MSKLSWKAEVLKLYFYGHVYSLAVCFCICILQFFATTLIQLVTYSERCVELEFIVLFHPTVLLLQDVQVWLHGTCLVVIVFTFFLSFFF